MDNSTYQLSCIVPIYNVEQYLEDCIQSLMQISNISTEIILVNDGSTDSSPEIADRYSKQSPHIRVIHQANSGLSSARNRGIIEAKGEYLAFIDSDDWIIPKELVRLYNRAKEENADMILGNILYVYPDGHTYSPFLPLPDTVMNTAISGKECFIKLFRAEKMVPMATSYLYRRIWVEQQGLNFASILHEDELWSVEAICLAKRVVCTNWTFYHYRQRAGSIMNTLNTGKRINSLLYISNKLLAFASRIDQRHNQLIGNLLYLKAARFYLQAFRLLDKMYDSRFQLTTHSLYQLYHRRNYLYPEVQKEILSCYRLAQKKLHSYHTWIISPEVVAIPTKIPESWIVLLFYNRMWEIPISFPREQVPENLLITTDKKYFERANVVVFHLPTLKFNLDDDLEKFPNQRWVGWTMECEENYPFIKNIDFMSLFDYWMTYHQGADVVQPYYEASFPKHLQKVVPLPFETKSDVCMFVSSMINQSKRQEYLLELMKYLPIDSYGKLFNNRMLKNDNGKSSKMELYRQYKFVIAFENACAEDYVTEKFFDPLLVGSVPIYFGAPNIDEYMPGDGCFVDVRKFKSPHDLALHLNACCKDPQLYANYQEWRNKPFRSSFIKKTAEQRIHPYIRLFQLMKKTYQSKDLQNEIIGPLVFCSFGDTRHQNNRERLRKQAEMSGWFDAIYLYDETDLSTSFQKDFQSVLKTNVRGFGYWVWKPRILLDTLAKINYGDILLYTDMDCELNSQGKEKLFAYWKEVKSNESGFLVSQLNAERKECFWTKGDLLDYFHIRGEKEMYTPQYQSGVIFIRKERKTITLVQKWLDVFYENFHLADDTPSQSNNEVGFIEHRHDQSILSLLLKQYGTSVIPLEEVYRPNWNLYSRFYPILTQRK